MALLAKNDGKRPERYAGAYEEFRKKHGYKVNAILEQPDPSDKTCAQILERDDLASECSSLDSEDRRILDGDACFALLDDEIEAAGEDDEQAVLDALGKVDL